MTTAYHVATTIDDALAHKAALGPNARWLAGGTALQLGWLDATKAGSSASLPDHPVIDISRIDCGPLVTLQGTTLRIAATAALEAVRRAPLVIEHLPVLAKAITAIAALGVRHSATIGGNLMWGAGDLAPLCLACDARLVLADSRTLSLGAQPTDALVVAITLPLPAGRVIFEKIGRRAAFSPSLVTVAALATSDGVRCAIGGGAVPPQLVILDGPADARALESRLTAPDDDFASGAHRVRVAAQVLAGHLAARTAVA